MEEELYDKNYNDGYDNGYDGYDDDEYGYYYDEDDCSIHILDTDESLSNIVTSRGTWRKLPYKPYAWETKPWIELTGYERAVIRSRNFNKHFGWGYRWIYTSHKKEIKESKPIEVKEQKKAVFSYKAMLQNSVCKIDPSGIKD